MPGIMIERPKMTRVMYQALKRQIMREREKIKQEQEQDEALERLKKERELKKKKEEEDSLTLEQTKEQIGVVDKKLETLRQEKHELFSQLKKVLHQEDESRKKAQQKEQSEMIQHMQQQGQQYHGSGSNLAGVSSSNSGGNSHPGMYHLPQPPTKYMSVPMHRPVLSGVKRARSPSPPAQSGSSNPVYSHYPPVSKYSATSYTSSSKQDYPTPKSVGLSYPSASSHGTYVSQSQHIYQPAQTQQVGPYQPNQSSTTKYPPGQSAFSSYPSHYVSHHQQQQSQSQQQQQQQQSQPPTQAAQSQSQPAPTPQQKGLAEHFSSQAAYSVQQQQQRVAQPAGYHSSSNLPLQQQLEQANQKSGFGDKLHQRGGMSAIPPQMLVAAAAAGQISASQPPAAGGGSIVSGYPVRSQTTTAYSASSAQNAPVSTTTTSRHGYPGQPASRQYY